MTAHDERDVETVAEALAVAANVPFPSARQKRYARAVLDALDLPGRARRAKAEALREAAEAIDPVITVGRYPEESAAIYERENVAEALRYRAAEIDPEEGDHE